MKSAIYGAMKEANSESSVRLLQAEKIGSIVREHMKENPIESDVCDSNGENFKSEKETELDKVVKD